MHRLIMSIRVLVVASVASWCVVAGVACSGSGESTTNRDMDGGAVDAAARRGSTDPGGDASRDAGASALVLDGSTSDAGDAGLHVDAGVADSAPDASNDPGPPSLVALSVSLATAADASVLFELTPAFSPDVHDYYVRCAAGPNRLTVSMAASEGSEALLVEPTLSPSLPAQTVSVSAFENEALVVAATNVKATTEYWVRCLPHDFPVLQWSPHLDAGTPSPGYYLLGTGIFLGTTTPPTAPTSGCYAMVLDSHGVPVWYSPSKWANGFCVFDVESVVSETISFDSVSDSPPRFEMHQISPQVTTTLAPTGDAGVTNVDVHELLLLANGNYLVLSTPVQLGVDLTGMQFPLADGGVQTLVGTRPIQACNLLELAPDGTVVWMWKATDHFDVVKDSLVPLPTTEGPYGNTLIDPIHCNSVDVDPTTGNLLVSAREMNSVFYVERSTGRVLWKMGGATYTKDNAAYVSVADPFVLQHDARFQPNWSSTCNGGSGQISLFDNRSFLPQPARAVVYDVVVGTPDGGAPGGCDDGGAAGSGVPGTATVSWQFAGPTSSLAMGNFRILPDGSRLIGWGAMAGGGFTELGKNGKDLLDFAFVDGNTTYRALKVPIGSLDLDALRASAGRP